MRSLLFCGATAVLILAGCESGGHSGNGPIAPPPPKSALDERIASIQPGLAQLRGMSFSRPIHSTVITREEFSRQTGTTVEEYSATQDVPSINRQLAQMGFFPDTLSDIVGFWTEFYSAFPAGYYVPGKDSIYILSEYADNEDFLRFALPHELVHVLQDQYMEAFAPRSPGRPEYYEGDFGTARNCLIEGDAEFTSTAFYFLHYGNSTDPFAFAYGEARTRLSRGFDRWKQTPPAERLFAPAATPYEAGMTMVAETHAAQGWEGVDALYSLNDRTSLSVLTGNSLAPADIDFSWMYRLFDTAGAYVDDYGNGSLQLMALFIPDLTLDRFSTGMGWRGDRLFYLKRKDETFGAMVWAQAYDSPVSAQFAYSSLKQMARNRFGGTPYSTDVSVVESPASEDEESIEMDAPEIHTRIVRSGVEVWWLENTGDRTQSIIDSLKSRDSVPPLAKTSASPPRPSKLKGPDFKKRFLHPFPLE